MAIARGAVPDINPDFAPSSARLRQLVDGLVSAMHLEARNIKSLLDAPVVLPDNSEMAKKTREGISAGFKSLGRKLDDHDRAARLPQHQEASTGFKTPSFADCVEIYKTRNLPGIVSRNAQRNVTAGNTVTVDDEYLEQAACGR